jgi:hypothetical protein
MSRSTSIHNVCTYYNTLVEIVSIFSIANPDVLCLIAKVGLVCVHVRCLLLADALGNLAFGKVEVWKIMVMFLFCILVEF